MCQCGCRHAFFLSVIVSDKDAVFLTASLMGRGNDDRQESSGGVKNKDTSDKSRFSFLIGLSESFVLWLNLLSRETDG